MKKLVLILCFVLIASTAFAGRIMFLSGGGNDSSVTGVPTGTSCICARDSGGVAVCSSTIDGIDIQIPSGTSCTMATAGQICVDTTANQIHVYGSADSVWDNRRSESMSVKAPADGDKIGFRKAYPITITDVVCATDAATSAVLDVQECDANAANCTTVLSGTITCGTTHAHGTISDASIAAGAFVKFIVGTVTGSVGFLYANVDYTVTAQ